MKFSVYLTESDFRELMGEAVIYVNVDSYLKILDDIDRDFSISYNTTDESIDILNKEFKYKKVEFKRSTSSKFGAFTRKDGSIVISVGDNFYHDYKSSPNSFRSWFKTMLEHELIHGEQAKKISFDFIKNKNFPVKLTDRDSLEKYLSHRHEIMAYAKTIILELQKKFRFDDKVLDFLRQPKLDVSASLDRYLNLFDSDDKVIKRLYKYMYEYIILGK